VPYPAELDNLENFHTLITNQFWFEHPHENTPPDLISRGRFAVAGIPIWFHGADVATESMLNALMMVIQ